MIVNMSTDSASRERHAFIDESVGEFMWLTEQPEVSQFVDPGVVQGFRSMLGNLVVANIDNGVVRLPQRSSHEADALPIVALRPGEQVHISPDLWGFHPRQLEGLEKARKPLALSDEENLEALLASYLSDSMPGLELTRLDGAAVFSGSIVLSNLIEGGEGLVRIRQRPMLALSMLPGAEITEPCTLAHELVHVGQRIQRPVHVIKSQRQVDMTSLREELEAYHTGAAIQMLLYDVDPDEPRDPSNIQIIVEAVRRKYGPNNGLDTFMPTPALLDKFCELGMAHILYDALDYDAAMSHLSERS
jgi:hypothetical protein